MSETLYEMQLFRERLSNKDNATMLKGIMGNVVSWTSIETLFVSLKQIKLEGNHSGGKQHKNMYLRFLFSCW